VTHSYILLFDWDGTLINSLEIKISHAGKIFHEILGLPQENVAAAYRRHSGIPRQQLFAAICTENNHPPLDALQYQSLSQRFSELNLTTLTNPQTPGLVPEDTKTVLPVLRDLGHPMYVSSSAISEELHQIARAHGIDVYFQQILGSAPSFNKGVEHIEYVRGLQDAGLDQILFIGDEPTDIMLGHQAGVRVIAKTGTYPAHKLVEYGADHVITSLETLPALINELV
jgi:phosphoglycolate phosphatase-like HAD superfamily hydrolase